MIIYFSVIIDGVLINSLIVCSSLLVTLWLGEISTDNVRVRMACWLYSDNERIDFSCGETIHVVLLRFYNFNIIVIAQKQLFKRKLALLAKK